MPGIRRTSPTLTSVCMIVAIRFGYANGLGVGLAAVGARLADHLPHAQTAAGKEQRARLPQWSRPPWLLICGVRPISPHTTSKIFSDKPRIQVVDQHGQGVIERPAHVVHAFGHGGVVDVGMHVPDEVRGDRDEAATALA